MRRIAALALLAALSAHDANATMMLSGAGPQTTAAPTPPGDALQVMLASMTSGQSRKITTGAVGSPIPNQLPRDCLHFDLGGSACTLFGSDANVSNNVFAGVGNDATNQSWSFSGDAIRNDTAPKIIHFGGGHATSADGSVYTLDILAAAANINSGGSGITWQVGAPSGRYQSQAAGTVPGNPQSNCNGASTYFNIGTNMNGQMAPLPAHTYKEVVWVPGTSTYLISGRFGLSQDASCNIGGLFYYDDSDGSFHGPISATPVAPLSLVTGYASDGVSIDVDPSTGDVWAATGYIASSFKNFVFKWTGAPATPVMASYPGSGADFPGNVNQDGLFLPPDSTLWGNVKNLFVMVYTSSSSHDFIFYSNLGPSMTINFGVFRTKCPALNGSPGLAWDATRHIIVISDGTGNLAKIVPNADLTQWDCVPYMTLSGVTGAGDVPAIPAAQAFVSAKVIPYADAYVISGLASSYIVKP